MMRPGKVATWASIAVTAVLVAGTMAAYAKYRMVWDSIHRVTITGLHNRPPKYAKNAMNLLVYGVDTRAGLTRHQQVVLHVGPNQGEVNTDTIMVVHISPGRGAITALSIPRDTEVPVYACAASGRWQGQQQDLAARVLVNSVYAAGGPSCLMETVEQLTGIRLDHFIQLNFTGFVKVINDLGGVNVCLPFAVHDSYSGLNLGRGEHHINGLTALEFWRTRYSIGQGTDLQRIQRDQYLVAQLLHGLLSSGLLSSPTRLLSVITDVAGSLTTDTGMTQSAMVATAESLRGISSSHIQFVTAPNEPYPADMSHVQLMQPQANQLFRSIAHDTRLPSRHRRKGGKPASASPAPTVPPSQVKVEVLNGSGAAGIAGQAMTALTGRGFDVVGTGDAASYTYTRSVIEYATASETPAVDTLKAQLSHVTVKRDPSLTPGTIELILGSQYRGLASATPAKSSSQSISRIAAKDGGISGSVACRADHAAFSGPNSP